MTITVPSCDSLNPERHNMQKILEVTKKMMELLTGEVGLEGDVMDDWQSLSSWDPPEEATPDEGSPFCKEEPLEERNRPPTDFPPPTDLTQHVSVDIKEEPDSCPGELVISHIMEAPLLPEKESLLHTEVSMAGDLLHLNVFSQHTPTHVKEELFTSDEGPLEELDVPTQCPSALVPQEASLEGKFTGGEAICFKWNVVDPQGVHLQKKPRQILPKPGHTM
ncbi:unnamed protein product [Staurois parvus]|nr:unnamed protein product [Staurois parvus]